MFVATGGVPIWRKKPSWKEAIIGTIIARRIRCRGGSAVLTEPYFKPQKDMVMSDKMTLSTALFPAALLTICIAGSATAMTGGYKCERSLGIGFRSASGVDCLVWKLPQPAQIMSKLRTRRILRQKCEALSEQTRAGHRSSWKIHQDFMTKCVSGKLPLHNPSRR